MEIDYIPFELALELKELGFYEKCSKYFKNDGTQHPSTINYCYNFRTGDLVSSPLFSQVFRWFREKYGIIGNVNDNCILENTYSISISKIFDSRILYVNGRNHNLKDKQGFTTYEEAELECLKKLIEIVKDGRS